MTILAGQLGPLGSATRRQAAAWTPDALSLALWLDADDAATFTLSGSDVVEWRDKSGNARHGVGPVGVRPKYNDAQINGKPTVSSVTANQHVYVDAPALWQSATTTFAVVRFREFAIGGYAMILALTDAASATHNGGGMFYLKSGGTWASYSFYNSSPYFDGAGAGALNTPYILGIESGSPSPALQRRWYLNGASLAPGDWANATALPSENTRLSLHGGVASGLGSGYSSRADFAEVVTAPGSLSTDDRQKVEGYLAHKWGTTASLPGGHPYKTEAP
jgi:hypothetical protein